VTVFILTVSLPTLWFIHWGALCVIFLRHQNRPTVLAIPLSFIGPVGALLAYAGTTRKGQEIVESPLLNPLVSYEDDLPQ
jgi:hypothetical protein